MHKDIELLTELRENFVEFSGYIRALSHAIDMMKEAGNDTEV